MKSTLVSDLSDLANNTHTAIERLGKRLPSLRGEKFTTGNQIHTRLKTVHAELSELTTLAMKHQVDKKEIDHSKPTDQEVADFHFELVNHDWYFDFSDDAKVWRAGRAKLDSLKKQAADILWKRKMLDMFQQWVSECISIGDHTKAPKKPTLEECLATVR